MDERMQETTEEPAQHHWGFASCTRDKIGVLGEDVVLQDTLDSLSDRLPGACELGGKVCNISLVVSIMFDRHGSYPL